MTDLTDILGKLDALGLAVGRLSVSAVVVEWAGSDYIHKRYGVNHMALRLLARGGDVRCKKVADGDSIPVSKASNTIYRVKDVEEWINDKAVVPDWVNQVKVG